MEDSTPAGGRKGLFERAKDILMSPKTEWGVIDGEASTVSGIFTGYVLILAALGPIASIIGQQVLGVYGFKPPIEISIASAVLSYVCQLVSVYVTALIIDALATSFGGTKNSLAAFKVAAYSATAYWIASIITIVPLLGWLAWIGALYGWYLLYLGLIAVMKGPQDKAIGYTAVTILVEIVLYFVFAMIIGMLVLSLFGAAMMAAPTAVRF